MDSSFLDNYQVFPGYPDVVTAKEVEEMLRLGRNAVYRLLKEGSIKTIRIGAKYLIPKKSVIAFVNQVP